MQPPLNEVLRLKSTTSTQVEMTATAPTAVPQFSADLNRHPKQRQALPA